MTIPLLDHIRVLWAVLKWLIMCFGQCLVRYMLCTLCWHVELHTVALVPLCAMEAVHHTGATALVYCLHCVSSSLVGLQSLPSLCVLWWWSHNELAPVQHGGLINLHLIVIRWFPSVHPANLIHVLSYGVLHGAHLHLLLSYVKCELCLVACCCVSLLLCRHGPAPREEYLSSLILLAMAVSRHWSPPYRHKEPNLSLINYH